tara:strand:+ start:21 stop:218 length:198 start_codon:yes stop_codon:yes gene_type:complete
MVGVFDSDYFVNWQFTHADSPRLVLMILLFDFPTGQETCLSKLSLIRKIIFKILSPKLKLGSSMK